MNSNPNETKLVAESPTLPLPSKDRLAAIAEKLGEAKLAQDVTPPPPPPKEPEPEPCPAPTPTEALQQVVNYPTGPVPCRQEWTKELDKKLLVQLTKSSNFDDLAAAMSMEKWDVMDRIHQLLHERKVFKEARQILRA
jgi:hypothetical protein